MTIALQTQDPAERLNRLLTVWLCRLAGAMLFGLGLEYWIRLVGVYDGPLWRFDTMPLWWQAAAPSLAVLYPVAGVGLWMTVSWGTVIWTLIAAVETVMHVVFPELFGGATPWLMLHAGGLSMLAVLKLIQWRENRQRLRDMG